MTTFRPPFTEFPLETSRVKLVLFSRDIHSKKFFATLDAHPEISRYLPFDITVESIEPHLADPGTILFAVIDKTRGAEGSLAGVIGLAHTSTENLSTEIGPVICFPEFQRTFVTSNAIGILLRYCLNLPKDGGLGFRRVWWTTNQDNATSVRAAERMGMKKEGVMRWCLVLPEGKEGKEVPKERGNGRGRHSVLLAAYWDEWEDGGRELVDKIVERA